MSERPAMYPHVETLYALKKSGRALTPTAICYRLGTSVMDVYNNVIAEGQLGPKQTAQSLRRQGWKAVKVILQEV